MSKLLAPVPRPPFSIEACGRHCAANIETEERAVAEAFRMLRRGARLTEVVDADGWKCNIYQRAESWA